jgi:hypothetical protein
MRKLPGYGFVERLRKTIPKYGESLERWARPVWVETILTLGGSLQFIMSNVLAGPSSFMNTLP